MNVTLKRSLYICIFVAALAIAAAGQNVSGDKRGGNSSPAVKVLNGTGKAAVIVVGSAAKAAWEVSKFTAKRVVKPAAKYVLKPLIVKGAPMAGKFLLRSTGVGAKYLLPIAIKLSVL